MGSITTAFCNSAKQELLQAGHCFNATTSGITGDTHTSTTLDNLSSLSGVAVGMTVTDATHSDVPANTVVAAISSATAIVLSKAATGSHTGSTINFTGDTFKIALIKNGPTGVYGSATVNYTDVTGNSDEVTGSGYSAGGQALTNVAPTLSSGTAITSYSPNPSWTSSSFSTDGCLIYNTSVRNGGTSGSNTTGGGRALGVFSFGSTQTVSSGTFTVLMPSFTNTQAVFRVG